LDHNELSEDSHCHAAASAASAAKPRHNILLEETSDLNLIFANFMACKVYNSDLTLQIKLNFLCGLIGLHIKFLKIKFMIFYILWIKIWSFSGLPPKHIYGIIYF
jgi:hypothetical protein